MDERTVRYLLADALRSEPPMGPVVRNALRAGIRIRRRRTTGAVGGFAAFAAIVGLLPAVIGLPHSGPNERRVEHGHVNGMGGQGDRPMQLTFSPNGKILATADNDGTARLWNVATQRQVGAPFKLSGVSIKNVAFSPDGKVLATADSDGTVRLWNVATHDQVGTPFVVSKRRVVGVAFSPGGRTLATASWDGTARLWKIATRRQIGKAIAPDHGNTPVGGTGFSVAFSPNGKLLLTNVGVTVRLWSVATHRMVGKPIGGVDHAPIISAVFSPDGKLIATSGPQNFFLWSVAKQEKVGAAMPDDGSSAWGVGFTPDGKILVTTDTDGTIAQWSVATHKQIRPVIAPVGDPEFLVEAVSPDGKLLATTQFDGPARLWVLSKA